MDDRSTRPRAVPMKMSSATSKVGAKKTAGKKSPAGSKSAAAKKTAAVKVPAAKKFSPPKRATASKGPASSNSAGAKPVAEAPKAAWIEIVPVNARGGITLPKQMREEIADDSRVVRVYADPSLGAGRFIVELVDVVPQSDRWFRSSAWQEKEREAQRDIDEGRVRDLPTDGLRR